jgi:hypothetical protein
MPVTPPSTRCSYVFSKALGDNSAGDNADFLDDYRTFNNGALDKQVLNFNHAQVFKLNGIYELPFGPGKPLLNGTNGVMSRIVGGWQIGAIYLYETGAPFSITQNASGLGGYTASFTTYTASQVAPIAHGAQEVGNGVVYFPGLTQVLDPSISLISPLGNLQQLSAMRAIENASGQVAFENSLPGQLGNLAIGSITGPPFFDLDVNLVKNIRFNERFTFQFRATAENLTNSVRWNAPTANIESATFGRVTTDAGTPRILVLQGRLYF